MMLVMGRYGLNKKWGLVAPWGWLLRFLAIEVKTKTGKVSPDQVKFLNRVNESGGLGFVARSVDDVIDTLGVRDRFLF